jgi:hypothetical protein
MHVEDAVAAFAAARRPGIWDRRSGQAFLSPAPSPHSHLHCSLPSPPVSCPSSHPTAFPLPCSLPLIPPSPPSLPILVTSSGSTLSREPATPLATLHVAVSCACSPCGARLAKLLVLRFPSPFFPGPDPHLSFRPSLPPSYIEELHRRYGAAPPDPLSFPLPPPWSKDAARAGRTLPAAGASGDPRSGPDAANPRGRFGPGVPGDFRAGPGPDERWAVHRDTLAVAQAPHRVLHVPGTEPPWGCGPAGRAREEEAGYGGWDRGRAGPEPCRGPGSLPRRTDWGGWQGRQDSGHEGRAGREWSGAQREDAGGGGACAARAGERDSRRPGSGPGAREEGSMHGGGRRDHDARMGGAWEDRNHGAGMDRGQEAWHYQHACRDRYQGGGRDHDQGGGRDRGQEMGMDRGHEVWLDHCQHACRDRYQGARSGIRGHDGPSCGSGPGWGSEYSGPGCVANGVDQVTSHECASAEGWGRLH